MNGDAIGGTVDFRTPNAFDFAKPFHMSVALSGRMETRDQDYGNAGLGGASTPTSPSALAMRASSASMSRAITTCAISPTASWAA
jgi:hypothetical protein